MDKLGAARLKFEGYVDEIAEFAQHARLPLGRGEEQDEAAAARSEQLAADGAGLPRLVVDLIDEGRRDLRRETAFEPPGFVEKPAEFGNVAGTGQNALAVVDQGAHRMQLGRLLTDRGNLLAGDL